MYGRRRLPVFRSERQRAIGSVFMERPAGLQFGVFQPCYQPCKYFDDGYLYGNGYLGWLGLQHDSNDIGYG